jgi:O-antigen/teichoic acid export membrane protein
MPKTRRDKHFDTEHLRADLKQRSLRGGAITLLSQGAKFVLGFGSTMVLARLLTPGDFGLVAMVAPIAGFVGLFKDLGLSMATIQNDRIDHRQISTLFWINVALSAVLAGTTVLLAPVVGQFYGDPRTVSITIAYGCMMFLGGFTAQHLALLQRQMRFSGLAAVEIVATAVSVAAAIAAAFGGFGYWSLVVMQAANAGVNLVMVWTLSGWRPGRPARDSGIRAMLKFGGNLTGANAMNYVARNIDQVLIGKVWGEAALGLYSKAYALLLFPLTQINVPVSRVAIPALSRLQSEPERYRRAYLDIVNKVLLITLPGMVTLILTADWVVSVVLGPQWTGAAEIFFWLGIAALTQPLTNTIGWLFITQGRTREHLHWSIIGSVLITVSVVGGLPWGPVGVAASYAITGLLLRVPLLLWLVSRRGPIRITDFFIVSAPFFVSALAMGAALSAVRSWWNPDALMGLPSLLFLAYLVQLGVVLAFPQQRKALWGLWKRRPT